MKTSHIILAPLLALACTACGMLGGDPASDGRAAFEQRDYHVARIALATAIDDAETRSPELLEMYARTLLALEDGEGAERAVTMLRESGSAPADIEGLAAHAALLRGDYDTALSRAEIASSPLAEWVAINALGELDRSAEAIARADAAVDAFPEDARLLALRGTIALSQRYTAEAKDYAARALEADPENHDAMMLAGQLRVMRGDYEGAREIYAETATQNPASIAAMFALAATEADLGNTDAAKEQLDRVLSIAPGHPLALLLDAKLAFVEGDLNEAQAILQSAEGDIGRIPQGRLLMGEVAYLRGFPSQAIVHLERFLQFQPGHIHGSTVLARAHMDQGDTAEAWALVAPLADSATATPQLLALASALAGEVGEQDRFAGRIARVRSADFVQRAEAAQAALNNGEAEEAERLYSALLADGGQSDAVILNNAAHAALRSGNKPEALRRARLAHELASRDPRVADTLGWTLLENGQSAAALTHLTRAVEGQPGNLQIRWHYANALIANGRSAEARRIIGDLREFAGAEQRAAMDRLLARI